MTTPTCTFVQGDVQTMTRKTAALVATTAGDILNEGELTLIAHANIAVGDVEELAYDGGIYDVTKAAGVDFTLGDRVHVDFSTGLAVTAPTANSKSFGMCVRTSVTNATTVRCTHAQSVNYVNSVAGSMTASDITGSDSSLAINGLAAAQGGAVLITGGTSSTSANAGGAVGRVGGTPGATGVGGAITDVGGAGGATSGAGGAVSRIGGAGTAGNAAGGAVSDTGGAGQGSAAGGALSYTGGAGGATGAGGAVTITGGAGGATSGTGGALALAGGAGTAGNANGGSVTLLAGNAHGSGTDGTIGIGTSNTSAITIGAASIATAITGPLTRGVGASTAAAGSTNADAEALPAGTAGVYPTTAADDTKGVILDVADKVTGRVVFVGNGVSNKILKVYPPSGGTINGAAANAAFSSASGKGVLIVCLDSTANTWLAL